MHKRTILTFLLLNVLLAAPLVGQAVPRPSAQDESLVIGAGDLLKIDVYDTPQLSQIPRVDDAGNVPLLFLGSISVLDDTPAQAAAAIEQRMIAGGVMRHPQVSVIVVEYATQDVSVIGQVSKPGNYPIRTPRSIMEVLSMAGGLTAVAERNIIVRRRGNPGVQETFFVANTPDNKASTDLKVYPGDTIMVPKVSFVYVLGDVARPGGYPMTINDSNATLLEMMAEAGSANKTASLSNARLLRKTGTTYKIVPIDLGSLQQGKALDLGLQADDVIYVPFSYSKNFLLNGSAIATSVAAASVFIP